MAGTEIVVVGSGFSGSIMARLFAERGRMVRVAERRDHIAGNRYDYMSEQGIRIHKYGPHVFHTNIERVYQFITRFMDLEEYHLKCEAVVDGISTPSPFNFKTIDQFYEEKAAAKLKDRLLDYYPAGSASVLEMLNEEDPDIKEYATFLLEKDYRPYTAKQWGLKAEDIDPGVLRRVPVLFGYRDTCFSDTYQGIPVDGFTELFHRILGHPGISIALNCDALDHIVVDPGRGKLLYDGSPIPIIYTGAIDELFGCRFGRLPYRSLYFEYETHPVDSFQNAAIVVHPVDAPYTRITEFKKLQRQKADGTTVIAREFSVQYDKNNKKGNEPYYPVLTRESQEIYEQYREYAKLFDNLVLCGRLADFKYYDMDMAVDRALRLFDEVKDKI